MLKKNGFSIIELVLVITIVGIIVAFVFMRFNRTVATDGLDRAAENVYREVASIRAIALKNDMNVLVRFSAECCSVFVDKDDDEVVGEGEFEKTLPITAPISIRIPDNGPSDGPTGITFASDGIAGTWKNTMIIKSDALGSISKGAIYLSTTRLETRCYCIGIGDGMYSIKLYRWDGKKWTEV